MKPLKKTLRSLTMTVVGAALLALPGSAALASEEAASLSGDGISAIPFETIPPDVRLVSDAIGLQGNVDVAGDLVLGGVLQFPDGTIQTTATPNVTTVVVSPLPFDPLGSGQVLRDALAAIVDAGPTRPYLLKLEPGIYDVRDAVGGNSLLMKPWVSIEGSGETVTEIRSLGGATIFEGAVVTADFSELRRLTVRNVGQDLVAIAVFAASDRSSLDHVTAVATGGTQRNYGVRVAGLADQARLFDVDAEAAGGSFAYGVAMKNVQSVLLERVRTRAEGAGENLAFFVFNEIGVENMTIDLDSCFGEATGATSSWGLRVEGPAAVSLRRSVLSASGDGYSAGAETRGSNFVNSLVIAGATISGTGPQSYGVRNGTALEVRLDQSRVAGETHGVANDDPLNSFLVGASRIGGGPASGDLKCVFAYDQDYDPLATDCSATGP